MKQIVRIAFWGIVLFGNCIAANAKTPKSEEYKKTYNYTRGVELYNESKIEDAIQFFQLELKEHSDNGYALAWLASLQFSKEENGAALGSVNDALKYLKKKDSFYDYSLRLRSRIYIALDEKDKALEDLNACVKLFPKSADAYSERAKFYLDKDEYAKASADYAKAIELEPGESSHYVGSGFCLCYMKQYDAALARFDYALKLAPKSSRAMAFRGNCLFLEGRFSEAADDLVKALAIDGDDFAFELMKVFADSAFETIDFKLKVQQMSSPNVSSWPYYRGVIREKIRRYWDAISMYEEALKVNFDLTTINRIGSCRQNLGDYIGALDIIGKGLENDPSDVISLYSRVLCLDALGLADSAIAESSHIIELLPSFPHGYNLRGYFKSYTGDVDGAINDYTMSLMQDNKQSEVYAERASLYERKGQTDLARKDYVDAIKQDSVSESAAYSWLALDNRDKAVAVMDSVLRKDSLENFYDAACLYSLMEESDTALKYLRKAFESGFRDFNHVGRDYGLDNIRQSAEFKALVEEYRAKMEEDLLAHSSNVVNKEQASDSLTEEGIPFTREGGLTKIKCNINGLPLYFIFDTGAVDVSISSVEATFMLKNGYLSERDIIGTHNYIMANGSISEGTVINLRKVKIGNKELDNVRASVVYNQQAPLLLGQTVLNRLGKIEIDNSHRVIKIKYLE